RAAAVHARREPGRRRVARRAPGAHDARLDPGGPAPRARHRRLAGAPLDRARARRGSLAGPGERVAHGASLVTASASEPPGATAGVLPLIGNTPLVRLTAFDTGPCELFVKLENQNPGGSIKDRIGLAMIEAAERDGAIGPGSTLVEATAGNTGLGLALVAARKGYRLILVIPDKMSREK